MARASRLVAALCFAVVSTGLFSVEAQDPERSRGWDPDFEPPRTSWGHPDLQGNWSNATLTRLERRPGLGRAYSWAQADSIVAAEQSRVQAGFEPSDPNRPVLEAANDPGSYNQVYFDRGNGPAIVNGEPRTSFITFPSDGRIPELSPEGLRRKQEYQEFWSSFGEFDHPELRPLAERCVVYYASSPTGTMGPPMTPTGGYNNNFVVVQNVDHVLIHAEMIHDVRIIRLGEPDLLPGHVRPWFGDSWGHWEGNTLVVETTNIHPSQGIREPPNRIVHSEDLKLIERFTRVDDDTILYEFEVHDPRTYSEVWGGEVPWESFDQQIFEYACHEGNYSLENVLRGGRYEDRTGAQREDR